jgi:competence protein ComEC
MTSFKQVFEWFSEQFRSERGRYFYWLPVFFGLGIAFYFALSAEPSIWLTLPFAAMALGCTIRFYKRDDLRPFLLPIAMIALGLLLAQVRTYSLGTNMLTQDMGPVTLVAKVQEIEREAEGARLTLMDAEVEKARYAPREMPQKIRLKVRSVPDELHPGDIVRVRGFLKPAPSPTFPGGFDFGRYLYFAGIGAVGFTFGELEILKAQHEPSLMQHLNGFRDTIIRNVHQYLDGDVAALTVALMTSEEKGLSKDAMQAMRASGLMHILSVSGLHLSMVSGLIFMFVRYLFLLTGFGLRHPIKKYAAVAAIMASFVYLLISGFAVPTQRSFFMIVLVFLAIMADRQGISLRAVALAALIILAIEPESLVSPSFQLSFAAVTALVAAYEYWRDRESVQDRGWFYIVWSYVAGAAMTTVIASLATLPFTAFHFNQITMQGIVANMIATPLSGFWIMPWMIVALFLMPFGLAKWPVLAMGYGCDWLLKIAYWVADWPGAIIYVPRVSMMALGLFVFAGLWLCLRLR